VETRGATKAQGAVEGGVEGGVEGVVAVVEDEDLKRK
jgi:hypothetical protein